MEIPVKNLITGNFGNPSQIVHYGKFVDMLYLTLQTVVDRSCTITEAEDVGIPPELRYLYEYIYEKCEGKAACDVNSTIPEWWYHEDDKSECLMTKTDERQYFIGVLVDGECRGMIRNFPPTHNQNFKEFNPVMMSISI